MRGASDSGPAWPNLRRALIAAAAALLSSSLAGAQQRMLRVGYLSWQDGGATHDATLAGFIEGLRSEGFVEGRNFELLLDARVQAVISTLLSTRNKLEREYAQAALKARLPSMFELELSAREGGLMSYGPDFVDIFRRAGQYAARVLKGGKPAEMPIEEPRLFQLVLNLKTARQLGLAIRPAVRLRAEVLIDK